MPCIPKFLLKPLFSLLAKPGIGAPHEGHETELMLAGHKPCMITDRSLKNDSYTQLQPYIESGDIIVIGTYGVVDCIDILCTPDSVEVAQQYAEIERRFQTSLERLSEEDVVVSEMFLRDHAGITDAEGHYSPEELKKRRSMSDRDEADMLLNGEIRATLPVRTGFNDSFEILQTAARKKIEQGTFVAVPVRRFEDKQVFLALRGCEDMGAELFARAFQEGKGYKPLNGEEYHRRIGHLLGYTPADTKFYVTTGTKPKDDFSLWEKFRIATASYVREARYRSLMMSVPLYHAPVVSRHI